jgi:hypothetical protein
MISGSHGCEYEGDILMTDCIRAITTSEKLVSFQDTIAGGHGRTYKARFEAAGFPRFKGAPISIILNH